MNKDDLITAFRAISLREGMMLEVHSSLSSFGQVEGGAQSVIGALQKDLTRCTVWSSVDPAQARHVGGFAIMYTLDFSLTYM